MIIVNKYSYYNLKLYLSLSLAHDTCESQTKYCIKIIENTKLKNKV